LARSTCELAVQAHDGDDLLVVIGVALQGTT
jgi:hypothetical protein